MTVKQATESKVIGRLIQIGQSMYCNFPPAIVKRAGLSKGDMLMLDTHGSAVVVQRVPWEKFKRAAAVVKSRKRARTARAIKANKHPGESEVS